MSSAAPVDRRGLFAAIAAYLMWGLFPLYWAQMKSIPPVQVVAHRIIWCCLFVVGWLLLSHGRRWLRQALSAPRVVPMLLASSLLISANWGIYIWAVTHEHVVEASLGYFINPLIAVLLGVVVLHERLNRWQWTAVGLAALGVAWLALALGEPPWIALILAISFGVYGLIRKLATVDAVPGLAIENLFLVLPALAWLGWAAWQGEGHFAVGDLRSDLMLVFGGALTALPLIGFAYGARHIPYSLIGLLQYIAPSLQLLVAVLILGESFSSTQAIGFGMIWAALAIYASDGWQRSRRQPAVQGEEVPVPTVCEGAVVGSDDTAPVDDETESEHLPSGVPSGQAVRP